jgi:hypothetical protein
VRIKQPLTKVGLKKKLRNDHWNDPVQIIDVKSDQNIEIELNGKRKIVNVDNKNPKKRGEIIRKPT